ncbi:MAG: bifunctional YncE family protein/alkaline phosphatase family protein [Bryobacterales bacterium]|nr:bifunctional YncE family protein/alkaline phosphatase family protein [Bryobacterales bacterium]
MRISSLTSLAVALLFVATGSVAQTGKEDPVRQVTDPGVVTTGQRVVPAGVQSVFPTRVYGVRYSNTSDDVYALAANGVVKLNWRRNSVEQRITLSAETGRGAFTSGIQSIAYHPQSETLFTVGMQSRQSASPAVVALVSSASGTRTITEGLGEHLGGAVAVASRRNSAGQHAAVAALTFNNELAIFDLAAGTLLRKAKVQIAPVGVALNADGSVAWVSNWGGKIPAPGDSTLPTGLTPDADQVVVDRFGIASTGTVSRVNTATGQTSQVVAVGLHPTALLLDESRNRLFVANGNSDTVSIVDTRQNRVVRTIELQPFARKVVGIAPTALALSADGGTLYVACGGINAVAVVHLPSGNQSTSIRGLIPTGWYPNGLDLSPDGKHLAVSTLLGVGSGWRDDEKKRFVHSYRGTVHVVDLPDDAQLESYTLAVAENNRMVVGPATRAEAPRKNARPKAIPVRAGEPSLVEHVVYIIKENRTYDQVFGDMPKGNGDPSLTMFGEKVTPNHHRLADQFVLLDNFYATGGNSGDGHQWVTQANEVDYAMWPGYRGRSYPFDGTDPIAYSAGGFIWDIASKAGKGVRVYGEYAGRLAEPPDDRLPMLKQVLAGEDFTAKYSIEAPLKPLNQFLAKNYPPYTNSIPDLARAQIFIKDVEQWERDGKMPNLVIAQLPCDHTFGTRPGTSTPAAMVADNDWALGQIVEALTKTSFWKKMAIFVVEDDAQNGVDHVDGHRTVALAISPYTRRGHVDSTFYANQHMLKTIEQILGLPNLSLFDLIATDMRNSFTDTPDFTPYEARKPEQDLLAVNPPLSALSGPAREAAEASLRMRFDVPDAAPTDKLNRILWHDVRGWDTPYPGVRQAAFAPLSSDVDDEDREVVDAEEARQ